ncbi:hypothetical protein HYPSUDRAFT_69313 [Hypholoma sublateritium FD-334 SS-4]|uniref:Uncharacterized protein n=1 Tax=Hypholoma sublateritium (strain FD-334 SS-4) TaxID=945553 RepID=A0A0D2M7S7_HYPSF|nr:hypothetical protein HYPSUDRAFT_69313 [Hypholoma sublateritium FD-334 SS-4]
MRTSRSHTCCAPVHPRRSCSRRPPRTAARHGPRSPVTRRSLQGRIDTPVHAYTRNRADVWVPSPAPSAPSTRSLLCRRPACLDSQALSRSGLPPQASSVTHPSPST